MQKNAARQLPAGAQRQQLAARGRRIEQRRGAQSLRIFDETVRIAAFPAKHPKFLQQRKFARVERTAEARARQRREKRLVDALADRPACSAIAGCADRRRRAGAERRCGTNPGIRRRTSPCTRTGPTRTAIRRRWNRGWPRSAAWLSAPAGSRGIPRSAAGAAAGRRPRRRQVRRCRSAACRRRAPGVRNTGRSHSRLWSSADWAARTDRSHSVDAR